MQRGQEHPIVATRLPLRPLHSDTQRIRLPLLAKVKGVTHRRCSRTMNNRYSLGTIHDVVPWAALSYERTIETSGGHAQGNI